MPISFQDWGRAKENAYFREVDRKLIEAARAQKAEKSDSAALPTVDREAVKEQIEAEESS